MEAQYMKSYSKLKIKEFPELKIEGFLGLGWEGAVLHVKNQSGDEYALKIVPNLSLNSLESVFDLVSVKFLLEMNKKHPELFTRLISVKISDSCICDFIPSNEINLDKIKNNLVNKEWLNKFKYCTYFLFSLEKFTLNSLLCNNSLKTYRLPIIPIPAKVQLKTVVYDLFIQSLNIACVITRERYMERDRHMHNTMVRHTNKKYMIIKGRRIPTHGYKCVGIDFTNVQKLDPTLSASKSSTLICVFIWFLDKVCLRIPMTKSVALKKFNFSKMNIPDHINKFITESLVHLDASERFYFKPIFFAICFFDEFYRAANIPELVLFTFLSRDLFLYITKNILDHELVLESLVNARNTEVLQHGDVLTPSKY